MVIAQVSVRARGNLPQVSNSKVQRRLALRYMGVQQKEWGEDDEKEGD